MKTLLNIAIVLLTLPSIYGQSDMEAINATLTDYIEGSTNGQPERLKKAFHPDLNLYTTRNNELSIYPGVKYIEGTKKGEPTGEKGTVISIDYENHVAVAKVEISHPENPNTYVDYFLLLKIEDHWTIVQKAYTRRASNKITKK